MTSIHLKAMAKINLGLDVIGKRPDGYHDLRMIMQTVRLFDRIRLSETPIIPIFTYDPIRTLQIQKELYDSGNYNKTDRKLRDYIIERGYEI